MTQPALPNPPSPLQLRDELETMVLRELLGPGSAEEEIIESPGTRCFVGVLAPRKRAGGGAAPARPAAVLPSSFGMTFSVNPEATGIDVSAFWGQYLREKSEYLVGEKSGNARLVWKWYPRGGKHRLTLTEGPLDPIAVDADCPEVVVRVP